MHAIQFVSTVNKASVLASRTRIPRRTGKKAPRRNKTKEFCIRLAVGWRLIFSKLFCDRHYLVQTRSVSITLRGAPGALHSSSPLRHNFGVPQQPSSYHRLKPRISIIGGNVRHNLFIPRLIFPSTAAQVVCASATIPRYCGQYFWVISRYWGSACPKPAPVCV